MKAPANGYTVNADNGSMDNYAVEPKVYAAEPPTSAQKRNYVLLGIGGAVLVASLVFVAVAASSI